jgi:two-component system cell cycle sensor histidine kinase PleC
MGPGLVGREDASVAAEGMLGDRILGEQARLLYRSAVPLIVNAVNTAIVAAVLWPQIGTPLVVWTVAMLVVAAGRAVLRARFRRDAGARSPSSWVRYHAVGAGLTGALWGATAVAVPLVESPLYHLFVGLTAAGMAAGAVAALSFHLPSFYAFTVPCVLPMIYVFARVGEPAHLGIAAMAVVFGLALTGLARSFNAALLESLRLRFANADLARDLSVAQDIAEAAKRSSWEIIAHMSHELRTPLNAINGFAEIIHRQMFGPLGDRKYTEYARDIAESAAHLIGLVDQILSYSRGHTGSLALDEAMVDPVEEIGICLQMHAEAASRAQVEIVRDVPSDLPRLRADPVKLRQILVNLLSNAVKFTPARGRITISAGRTPDGGLEIAVADTGIGIGAEDLRRVVQPYVQIENVLTRTRSGLGLGLPLAKQLVELHGGQFRLASTLGAGTTVTVCFPASRCEPSTVDLLSSVAQPPEAPASPTREEGAGGVTHKP